MIYVCLMAIIIRHYIVSYYLLSRQGMGFARKHGIPGFYYIRATTYVRHYGSVLLNVAFDPANSIDCSIGPGMPATRSSIDNRLTTMRVDNITGSVSVGS